jgi:hypothetical protein
MRHSSMPAVSVATIPASFLFTTVWTELRGRRREEVEAGGEEVEAESGGRGYT